MTLSFVDIYTLSPTTPVFVESTIYNYNFSLHQNPVAHASNINIKTSIAGIPIMYHQTLILLVLIYELNFELVETM